MKVAAGLRGADKILDKSYLQFLRQIGVTHIVCFMPDSDLIPSAKEGYWGAQDLIALKKHFADNGLALEAIENFLPIHWYKIIMDLPGQEKQLENVKRTIDAMGKAGIPIMGYNMSAAGVYGRATAPVGRGGAIASCFDPAVYPVDDSLIPRSMAWNRVLEPEAEGVYPGASREEMKGRLYRFLEKVLPVAQESGVQLAAHPEDPPIPYARGFGRVLISPQDYDEMLEKFPTRSCGIEFCQGTFTEMGVNVYDAIAHFAATGKIGYVHLRNVRGRVPSYHEALIDDGDVDMALALKLYHDNGFDGMVIPDHYPVMAGDATGMGSVAFSIGYIRGLLKAQKLPIWGE